MRTGRLYLKIFLSFLAVLFLTEILIFGLFFLAVGHQVRGRLSSQVAGQALVLGRLLEERGVLETADGSGREKLDQEVLAELGRVSGARIWITGQDGRVLAKSFPGEGPINELGSFDRRLEVKGPVSLRHSLKHGWDIYATLPLQLPGGRRAELHLLTGPGQHKRPEVAFPLGLALIGLIVALLVIPVSRLITRPLKGLTGSALRIAGGELDHRAEVSTRDEIGELAKAFNLMTGRLEEMIRGARELLANVSHELRSPLARIRVASELVQEDLGKDDHDRAGRHLAALDQEIELLDRLLGRLLYLSRMDLRTSPPRKEDFDLAGMIGREVDRLRPGLEKMGLSLSLDLPERAPFRGDPAGMQTVLSNLLDNALKFTSPGGRIGLLLQAGEEGLSLSLTNTHPPLSREELSEIFLPFRRAGNREAAGSGLGLAMVRKIVESQGGEVWAVNTAEGIRFQVRLPGRAGDRPT